MLTAYKSFPATSTAVDPTTALAYVDQYNIFTVGGKAGVQPRRGTAILAVRLSLGAAAGLVSRLPAGIVR
jgi:hypothetical protein